MNASIVMLEMSNLSVIIDKGEGVGLGRVINFWVRGCLGRGDVVYFRSDFRKNYGRAARFRGCDAFYI